jgi:predicted ATP-dependent protease
MAQLNFKEKGLEIRAQKGVFIDRISALAKILLQSNIQKMLGKKFI